MPLIAFVSLFPKISVYNFEVYLFNTPLGTNTVAVAVQLNYKYGIKNAIVLQLNTINYEITIKIRTLYTKRPTKYNIKNYILIPLSMVPVVGREEPLTSHT